MKSSKKAGRKRKIVKELDELIENFTKPADKVVDSSCYEQGSPKKRAKVVCNSHSTATCSSTSMMKVSAETELAAYPNAKTQDEIRKQETGLSVRYNLNFEQFEEMLLIIQIAQHVPVAFKQTRQEMALLIMESLCPRSKEQVVDLLKEADSLPSDSSLRILAGKPPEELLWKVHTYCISHHQLICTIGYNEIRYSCEQIFCTSSHRVYKLYVHTADAP
jgi:hypothetical protein